ncbi:glycosyltransferase [Candidatus Sumerlaeota bacterium]|nr:glycosyltransferase [Candidatus Sumerlaeota bacterium]
MKKLLIITYDFPPALSGVRRVLKWIKYLPDFGWKTLVLTVKPVKTGVRDATPLEWLKNRGVPVFRSGSMDPYRIAEILSPQKEVELPQKAHAPKKSKSFMNFLRRWIFIPDDRCGWIPFATFKGWGLIRRFKPDAMLSTSYPNTAHIVGLKLKTLTGIPWVADFRDAWTTNPVFFDPPTPFHGFLQRYLEKWVARKCDLLLTVSEPITEHFRHLKIENPHSAFRIPHSRIHTLTNGYDEEDYVDLVTHPSEKFRIVYTGTLFGGRTALPFLKIVKELLSEHPEWKGDMEICFFSALDQTTIGWIRDNELDSVIRVEGLQSYKESLQQQMNASVLMLILETGANSEVMMSQKVFEYLRSAKQILALIPEGACRNLLLTFGDKYISDPSDHEGIKRHITELYGKWKSGNLEAPNRKGIENYERRNLTEKLARHLDDLKFEV